ncbi:hypothetical protein HanOQP8_Chr17g0665401 [Helianthus annuus]|nr:hypothetical protein HanIR_Chr17g0878651 [Helianthus annuus]KAJ0636735.1 hypothetical protein HanOQP8_Chr17g0665401 [Helianthus annuus]
MDTQKECEIQVHQLKEIEEQYQLLNRERSRINEELAQQKEDEHHINNELMWLSHLEKQIERRMSEIKMLESYDPDKVKLSLPVSFVPRTTGFLCLTGKDAHTQVRPDLKRCKRRLVKKGRMDIQYLEEVQEQHVTSVIYGEITYCGTQKFNDMVCFCQL